MTIQTIDVASGSNRPVISNALGYGQHCSRSHHAVIRVHDVAGNMIKTHQHKGEFKDW
jgi:hypothetical protein